ncbi:cuticle protein 19.8-like [Armigeres subalbatus]|uniref:cuticle protein 19.8-like n=1 Tax=Armigeres subalbatus TaxID=124917 RepID=UPI002ED0E742
MKLFVVVSSLLAVATAAPSLLTPQVYAAIPATTYVAAAAPVEVSSQFHAQDALGQYTYGYNGGLSAKTETKAIDGVTRGAYSYLDAENKLQTVSYTADAINGFRAEASNLPVAPIETRIAPEPVQDTPEVVQAKAEHLAAIEEAKVRNAAAEEEDKSSVAIEAAPVAPIVPVSAVAPISYAAPAVALAPATGFSYSTSSLALKQQPIAFNTYAAAPVPAAVELKTPSSFSYSTYTQSAPATIAVRTAEIPSAAIQYTSAIQQPIYGYSYGIPAYYTTSQFASPVAIAARALPVAEVPLPVPVQDTPEVAQAKAEHLQAVAEVKARNLQ